MGSDGLLPDWEQKAGRRDRAAVERDEDATARDDLAAERDHASGGRDELASDRERAAHEREQAALVRDWEVRGEITRPCGGTGGGPTGAAHRCQSGESL